MKKVWTILAMVACGVGCGASSEDAAPEADDLGLDETQISYATDGSGWSVNADAPIFEGSGVTIGVTFGGPTGSTYAAGACIVQKWSPSSPRSCTGIPRTGETKQQAVDRECGTAPTTLPVGGNRYCAAPNNSGTKYCYFRPGTQVDYCLGTPASGQLQTPGYKSRYKSNLSGTNNWLTIGCLAKCAASDPSSSSSSSFISNHW